MKLNSILIKLNGRLWEVSVHPDKESAYGYMKQFGTKESDSGSLPTVFFNNAHSEIAIALHGDKFHVKRALVSALCKIALFPLDFSKLSGSQAENLITDIVPFTIVEAFSNGELDAMIDKYFTR